MENYGTRLKQARKDKGYTQTEIAKIMNVPQQNWQRYESGTLDLKMSTICRICKALNISADWLLGLDMEEEATTRQLYAKARNEIYRASKAIDNGSMSGEQKAALLQQLQHLMDELK